jgi:hypothetical protein
MKKVETGAEAREVLAARGMTANQIIRAVRQMRDEDDTLGLFDALIALANGYRPGIAEREHQTIAAYAALEAERDALAARVAALEAALRPAWEAEAGATPGEWTYHPDDPNYSNAPHMVWGSDGPGYGTVAETCSPGMMPYLGGEQAANARLIAAAVNAVRAAREVK